MEKKSKDEIFKEKQQSISDEDLLKNCHKALSKLCKTGGQSFTMTVPCQIDDTDMLFSELFRRFELIITNETI